MDKRQTDTKRKKEKINQGKKEKQTKRKNDKKKKILWFISVYMSKLTSFKLNHFRKNFDFRELEYKSTLVKLRFSKMVMN